jgi:hypothetical protein
MVAQQVSTLSTNTGCYQHYHLPRMALPEEVNDVNLWAFLEELGRISGDSTAPPPQHACGGVLGPDQHANVLAFSSPSEHPALQIDPPPVSYHHHTSSLSLPPPRKCRQPSFSEPCSTLQQALAFSRASLAGPLQQQLVIFQLLQALRHLHESRGRPLSQPLSCRVLLLTHACWLLLPVAPSSPPSPPPPPPPPSPPPPPAPTASSEASAAEQWWVPSERLLKRHGLPALTLMWQARAVSNLDYLLALNLLVGRRPGDPSFHPFLPWVLDLTHDGPPDELREPSLHQQQQQQQQQQSLWAAASSSSTISGPASAPSSGWHDLASSRHRQSKGDLQV